jgi:hypothetical protein
MKCGTVIYESVHGKLVYEGESYNHLTNEYLTCDICKRKTDQVYWLYVWGRPESELMSGGIGRAAYLCSDECVNMLVIRELT